MGRRSDQTSQSATRPTERQSWRREEQSPSTEYNQPQYQVPYHSDPQAMSNQPVNGLAFRNPEMYQTWQTGAAMLSVGAHLSGMGYGYGNTMGMGNGYGYGDGYNDGPGYNGGNAAGDLYQGGQGSRSGYDEGHRGGYDQGDSWGKAGGSGYRNDASNGGYAKDDGYSGSGNGYSYGGGNGYGQQRGYHTYPSTRNGSPSRHRNGSPPRQPRNQKEYPPVVEHDYRYGPTSHRDDPKEPWRAQYQEAYDAGRLGDGERWFRDQRKQRDDRANESRYDRRGDHEGSGYIRGDVGSRRNEHRYFDDQGESSSRPYSYAQSQYPSEQRGGYYPPEQSRNDPGTKYLPPNLRQKANPLDTSFSSSQTDRSFQQNTSLDTSWGSSPNAWAKSKRKGDFVPVLPPAEYLELSHPRHLARKTTGGGGKKLLVLDLNGALLYRTKGTEKSVYPRPYLGNFLEYLFTPDSTVTSASGTSRTTNEGNGINDGEGDARGYEVFVWSSAQPHNVRTMVETAFGPRWTEGVYSPESEGAAAKRKDKGEGRLMGVWARDMMDLNPQDYGQNVQTFKDLRKIVAHISHPPNNSFPSMQFDEKSVILLDDSPLKAVNQPWNQIVVPEFDKAEFQQAKDVLSSSKRSESGGSMDQALLGVIGVLEALRGVENVPAWVRAGGLLSPSSEGVVGKGDDGEVGVELADLPSHADFAHWYADEEILKGWIERGNQALERRGIKVDPGIDQNGRRKRTGKSPRPA